VSLFESQGAVRLVSDEASLTNTLRFLLSSPKERETLGCLVRNLADRQRGALDASLHLLRGVF